MASKFDQPNSPRDNAFLFERCTIVLPALLGLFLLPNARAQLPSAAFGLNFSPYVNGQDPNSNPPPQITVSQLQSRLGIIAPYAKWVRTFGSTNGLEQIPSVARSFGLKVAAGAWISSNASQNSQEISNLIANVNAGLVDIAVVGSEAVLRNDVTPSQLIAYITQVRQAIPPNVPVTTADVYGTFLANPSLIAASDVIFANFYPFWEQKSINKALCSLEEDYQQLVNASIPKQVWISETGWPSAGNAEGLAVPSLANENLYALWFFNWSSANSIPSFYFEAFDEAWKANYEGPQGAHWGIFDVNGVIKPGMNTFFGGQTATTICPAEIPAKTDFNRDGRPDIVWQNSTTGNAEVWYMGGAQGSSYLGSNWLSGGISGWAVVGVGDFDSDGTLDLVWQNTSSRAVVVWYMGGTQGSNYLGANWLSGSAPGWTVAGVADLNLDGIPDLIWQNDSTRQVVVWYMGGAQGSVYQGSSWISGVSGWTVVGTADLNGDGVPDLIWQNDSTRQVVVWYMGGPQGTTYMGSNWLSGGGSGWKVVGAADFNLDGTPDLVWQSDTTQQVVVWYMTGAQGNMFLGSSALSGSEPGWTAIMR